MPTPTLTELLTGNISKLAEIGFDFIKWLFGYLRQPVLAVSFEREGEPFVGADATNDNRIARFYRLSVANTGKTPAEECQAYLVSIEPIRDRRVAANLLGKPEPLKWAHETEFHPIGIEAGERRKLDLVYAYDDEPGRLHFYFRQPEPPVGVETAFGAGHPLEILQRRSAAAFR